MQSLGGGTMGNSRETSASATLPNVPGFARLRRDPRGGRSDEFRLAERLRGDHGGGPNEDGIPSVPNGRTALETEQEQPPAASTVGDLTTEHAIIEVEARFDEPALEGLDPPTSLWSEALEELARRLRGG